MRALFVPLRTEYFNQFADGSKSIEYRRHTRQWTAKHCYPGRLVMLSHGYSGRRLSAVIEHFEVRVMDSEVYGPQAELSLIHLRLVPATPSQTESIDPTSLDFAP